VDLHEDKRQKMMMLVIQAYVYDHRFASAMKTEILRRTQREFLSHGILTRKDGTASRGVAFGCKSKADVVEETSKSSRRIIA
jgi:hypothetical protein